MIVFIGYIYDTINYIDVGNTTGILI